MPRKTAANVPIYIQRHASCKPLLGKDEQGGWVFCSGIWKETHPSLYIDRTPWCFQSSDTTPLHGRGPRLKRRTCTGSLTVANPRSLRIIWCISSDFDYDKAGLPGRWHAALVSILQTTIKNLCCAAGAEYHSVHIHSYGCRIEALPGLRHAFLAWTPQSTNMELWINRQPRIKSLINETRR